MRLRTNVSAWGLGLFAALGLPVSACGSTSDEKLRSSYPCSDPTPAVSGYDSGYELCAGFWVHRPEIVACQSQVPRAGYQCGVPGSGCTDADCMTTPNGYCESYPGGGCGCTTGCLTDADCSAGEICVCNEVMGKCAMATCKSDADCPDGNLCASYDAMPQCGDIRYACQTGRDQCASDADCKQGSACTVVAGRRVCAPASCVIGRPFLIAEEERRAHAASRSDWCATQSIDCSAIPRCVREVLARRWTDVGLMEHASVAAFARFSLQLLALGAPPDLIADSARAAADEIEHARVCFALASAHAGRSIGPGTLRVEDALESGFGIKDVLRLVVREGCIGETVAALEAREASEHATDATLKSLLARIAEDELRHAQLAWRFARWALEITNGALGHVLAEELAEAVRTADAVRPSPADDDALLLHHGVVGAALGAEIRRLALRVVVAPCAGALGDRARASVAA